MPVTIAVVVGSFSNLFADFAKGSNAIVMIISGAERKSLEPLQSTKDYKVYFFWWQ